jgi:hypothetical protein
MNIGEWKKESGKGKMYAGQKTIQGTVDNGQAYN